MAAAAIFVVVVFLTAYDQLVVEYGDDDSYLLGKATPLTAWIVTLATPFALFDFFVWLWRTERNTAAFWRVTVGVVAAFLIGVFASRGWTLVWLIEGDFEVRLFLPVFVGLWSACLAAIVIGLHAKPQPWDQSATAHEVFLG